MPDVNWDVESRNDLSVFTVSNMISLIKIVYLEFIFFLFQGEVCFFCWHPSSLCKVINTKSSSSHGFIRCDYKMISSANLMYLVFFTF